VIRFSTFPRTDPPPDWCGALVNVFRQHEDNIGTLSLEKGLTSNVVLGVVSEDLSALGFAVDAGKLATQRVERPVFFGENGIPTVRYQIDAYHPSWRCGLEIEAGRAWMGNAVYRDLIQALVMVDVDWLCLAVPNGYRYTSGGKLVVSRDYDNTRDLADAIFGHTRLKMPYRLILVGY
jgi:hypothetical protein